MPRLTAPLVLLALVLAFGCTASEHPVCDQVLDACNDQEGASRTKECRTMAERGEPVECARRKTDCEQICKRGE